MIAVYRNRKVLDIYPSFKEIWQNKPCTNHVVKIHFINPDPMDLIFKPIEDPPGPEALLLCLVVIVTTVSPKALKT